MSVTNRDSSLLTQKRRDKVLYGFFKQNQTDVNNGVTVRHEQTTPVRQDVVTQRHLGACPYQREILRSVKNESYVNYDYADNNTGISKHTD